MSDARRDARQQLLAGLHIRGGVPGGADKQVLRQLERYVQRCTAPLGAKSLDKPPPRRVAVAFALAVFSQPHLVNTFRPHGTRPAEALLVTNEVLEGALGISGWELDDLRDEVDRRARTMLKQDTLVNWLTGRHDYWTLVELLLPGVDLGDVEVHPKRGQLYVGTGAERSNIAALYLPWISSSSTVRFRGRYADSRIKLGMARGIGTTNVEAIDLLERTVMVVPKLTAEDWIEHDHWRLAGMGSLTSIGAAPCNLDWLTHRIEPGDLKLRDWIDSGDQGIREAFDELFRVRVHGVLQALYTDRIAVRSRSLEFEPSCLTVYDIKHHLRTVAEPLLEWTRDPGSATWLSTLGLDPDTAPERLDRLRDVWSERLEFWLNPDPDLPSALDTWFDAVGTLDHALRILLGRERDFRFRHHEVAMLFAAHLVNENPLPRGLMSETPDEWSPGQVLSKMFWPTWLRLLDTIDSHNTGRTNAEFMMPEGF